MPSTEEMIEDMLANPEQVIRDFKEISDNTTWVNQQWKELVENYPNRYIAVYQKEVIESDDNFTALLNKIKQRHDSKTFRTKNK